MSASASDFWAIFGSFDRAGLAFATHGLRPPGTERLVAFLARDEALALLSPLLLLWIVRGRARAIRLALTALGMVATAETICGLLLVPLTGHASPAGDALTFPCRQALVAFALGTFLAFYYPRHATWMLPVMVVLAAAPVCAGLAWPTDAIGGAVIGFLFGNFFWALTRRNLGRPDIFAAAAGSVGANASRRMSRR